MSARCQKRKPRRSGSHGELDPRNVQDLKPYSTDDPRHIYHAAGGDDPILCLRDGMVSREELIAEIRRRIWWDRFGYISLAAVAVIGMIAAVVAAIASVIAVWGQG